jgi:hypothetical protein
MRLNFSKSIVLAFLIACPKTLRSDDTTNKIVGVGFLAAAAGFIAWILWPESDENVIKSSEDALQATMQEHEAFLSSIEAIIDRATAWNVSEQVLENLARKISSPRVQRSLLKSKREKLENSRNTLKARLDNLVKERYNPDKKLLYDRANNTYNNLLAAIARLKAIEDLLSEHEDYFSFYTDKHKFDGSYYYELKGKGEFPLIDLEQTLANEKRTLRDHLDKLKRYPLSRRQVEYSYNELNARYDKLVADSCYKEEQLKYKEKELKRKEEELKREKRAQEEQLKKRKKELEKREFEQKVRGVNQFFNAIDQEIRNEELKQKQRELREQQQRVQQSPVIVKVQPVYEKPAIEQIKTEIIQRTRRIASYEIERMRNNPPFNPELLKEIDTQHMIQLIVATIQNEVDYIYDANQLLDSYTDNALRSKIQNLAVQFGIYAEKELYEPILQSPSTSAKDDFAAATAASDAKRA